MRLSILIPVFNAEKHLARCINSLLEQGLSQDDFEILIRDDGSTDKSAYIAKSFADRVESVHLFKDSNRGAYAQRNLLLKQAKGDYIYFVDADDYLAGESLSKILDYSEQNDLDLSGFGVEFIYFNSKEKPRASVITHKPNIVSGTSFIENNIEMRHEIWWYLIKNEFVKKNNISFKESRYHNDVMFTLNLFLKAKRVSYFPQTIYYYFQSENSIMRSSDSSHHNKLVDAGKNLITSVAAKTRELEKSNENYSIKLINAFKYKRDQYSFYLIVKMLKRGYSITEILNFTAYLEELNSYPIKYFSGKEFPRYKFYMVKTLINNTYLMKAYLAFNNSRKN